MNSETFYTIQQIKEALAEQRRKQGPANPHEEEVATIMDKVLEVIEDLELRTAELEKKAKKIKKRLDE